MWKVIYIAKGKAVAEAIRDALMAEGFLVQLRPVGRGAGEETAQQYEVMTSKAEAGEAYELLTQVLRRGV
jgi:hypothetical protein